MGRPPAVVIVARHGARLDAADKQWHLTSPTPYDPPLTYGGWTQCRALGARIASLLQAREELFETTDGDGGNKDWPKHAKHQDSDTPHTEHKHRHKRHKKHKIVIHSSPFLRCIQTSVAISAGISQWRGQQEAAKAQEEAPKQSGTLGPPPKATGATSSPNLSAIADEDSTLPDHHARSHPIHSYSKPHLRIDAFLGEWLSPDYYENITPPPGSVMMVASAKADLLRRGEYIDSAEDPTKAASSATSSKGHFPGGWGSTSSTAVADETEKLAQDLSHVSLSGVQRERASTVSSNSSSGHGLARDAHALRVNPRVTGYVPPVPRYAISPSNPIPAGYVGHARDACVDVDYQWDSMRPPQDWGDGGEYGEEWSSMHKRFRRGLQSMIAWYRLHHETSNQLYGHKRVLHPQPHDEDDEDTDTVLILVSHGAGCNALIGALTNQPVLLDVSMASLTMAIRRDEPQRPELDHRKSHSPSRSPMAAYTRHAHDHRPLSGEYIVQLTASTDHLRATSASQPLTVPLLTGDSSSSSSSSNSQRQHSASLSQSSSNILAAAPGPRVVPRRNRFDSVPAKTIKAATENPLFTPPDSPSRVSAGGGGSNALFGVQRSASLAAHSTTSGGGGGGGLWSRPASGTTTPQRTWSIGHVGASLPQPATAAQTGSAAAGPTSAPAAKPSGAIQGEGTQQQHKELGGAGAGEGRASLKLKSGTNITGSHPAGSGSPGGKKEDAGRGSADSERDLVSPLVGGGGGLWGSNNSGAAPASGSAANTAAAERTFGGWGGLGGLAQGRSAMAMALRGDIKEGPRETADEITERERGMKRRWTVNERSEM